MLMLLLLL